MMRRALVLLALLPCGMAGQDEESRVAWLKSHAVSVRSIGPEDEDFSDLMPLKKILRDVRVVQLGEQSHGDGATFHAKTRLVRFLHQEMGFDVIAFESGLFDCRKAWEAFRAGKDPYEAGMEGIFPIWTRSRQFQPLLQYLSKMAKGRKPLEVAGFDCQFSGRGSRSSLVSDLSAFVRKVAPKFASGETLPVLERTLKGLLDHRHQPTEEEKKAGHAAFLKLQKALAAARVPKKEKRDLEFWRQMARSLIGQARNQWSRTGTGCGGAGAEAVNLRDAQMAENLVWLADRYYEGRKIIVWAATFHVMRNASTIDFPGRDGYYRDSVPMGHLVWKSLGREAYTLGFIAHEGRAGAVNWGPRSLDPSPEGSLESLLARAGFENALLDFRTAGKGGAWLRGTLTSRPLGYSPMRADWTQVVDGMFFTREMFPSVDLKKTK